MNKAISISLIILCLLSISSLIVCKTSVKASPKTWTVDDNGPADFHTIQEAINNAASGDTILVHNGTYLENVAVNKSVSLIGEDRDLTIVDGSETGSIIYITANNVSVKGFTIKKSGEYPYDSGIHVEHSSGDIISHNKIVDNYDGIVLSSSSNNVVSDNIVSSNQYDGIVLYSSSNNVVSDNTISNNYAGIVLYSSSNNVVSDNTISNNYAGIVLALYSSNTTIYRNNFHNTVQALSDSTNVWSYDDEGNYWSDYTGQDLNGDGIGDNPYVIDVDNRDSRPLMGTFSDFNITSVGETYHVTVICNSTISDFRFEIGAETGNKIIRFNVAGEASTVGFCRVTIPTRLMNYSLIVLVGEEEVVPTILGVSNAAFVRLYLTYMHSSRNITIISSKTLYLCNELLDRYFKLQMDLNDLNVTYHDLLNNYSIKLQMDLNDLNVTYHDLLNNYSILLGNYSELQESYRELDNSYEEHLLDYSENMQNIQNLVYIFAATTAIFIIATIYLSKLAHSGTRTRAKSIGER